MRKLMLVILGVVALSSFTLAQDSTGMKPEARPYFNEALNLFKEDKLAEALVQIDSSLIMDKTYKGLSLKGDILIKNGDLDKAKEVFNEAIAIEPNTEVAHMKLGQIAYRNKQYDEAIQHYEKAASVTTNEETRTKMNELVTSLKEEKEDSKITEMINEGVEHFNKKEYDQAIVEFDEALKVKNDPKIHYQKGLAYLALKKGKEAATSFQTAVDLDPKFDKAYVKIAEAQTVDKKYDQAIVSYRKVIEVTEDQTLKDNAKTMIGKLTVPVLAQLVAAKKYDDANALMEQAETDGNANPAAFAYYRGQVFKAKNNKAKAIEQFGLVGDDAQFGKAAKAEIAALKNPEGQQQQATKKK